MKTLNSLLFVLFLCTILSCGDKSKKNENAADYSYDALEKTYNTNLKAGLNTILQSEAGDIALKLNIVEGKKPEYIITENGVEIPSDFKQTTEGNKTTCWRCARDGDGNLHCFIIACPKDLDPIGNVFVNNTFKLSR
ncbi:hypothetical protein [Aestuariivivens insulae]|uniref:hypothetical protein n=1 Tax=Aestuariivivens insulae TaxID=1621988 RepID=UPI001F58F0C7|nr:hypothetical protein [Aestuariivivens insulae]